MSNGRNGSDVLDGFELPAGEKLRRLFFALLPPDPLREQLERDMRPLLRGSGGRVIPARNFHVTLLFVGDVLQSLEPAVIAAGAATTAAAFTLTLDRIDAWPGSNVLVLTGGDAPAALVTLVERLRFNLLNNQIKLTREIYQPHITLVRKLQQMRPAERIAAIEWPVQEFALVESTLTHGGSDYRILARWPLA